MSEALRESLRRQPIRTLPAALADYATASETARDLRRHRLVGRIFSALSTLEKADCIKRNEENIRPDIAGTNWHQKPPGIFSDAGTRRDDPDGAGRGARMRFFEWRGKWLRYVSPGVWFAVLAVGAVVAGAALAFGT